MSVLEVKIEGMEAFRQRLEAIPKTRAKLMQAAASAMKSDVLLHFKGEQGPDGPWKPSRRARTQGRRTLTGSPPNLMKAIADKSDEETAAVGVLRTGPAVRYARIHQYGGVIVPTKGKCLAIPWSKQAEAAGRPRNMPNLTLVWPKGAKSGWLVEHKPGRGKNNYKERDILHWLLVRKVTIPARPYLWLSDAGKTDVLNRMAVALAKALGGE